MEDFHSSHGRQSLSSSTNGMDNPSSSGHHAEKKWKNYKLMIDPFIKKGQQKVYRYDGLIHGPLANVFPSPLLRDPRSKISRLWRREKADLPIPKFKFDKYYIGEVPPKQITFTNLNDNVKERFLRDLCDKFGTIEDVNIMHHPKTNKHLGLATVTFTTTRAAKVAAGELNRMSVMGKIIIVQVDAGGKECERIFDCLTTGKASTPSSSGSTPYDPRYGGKRTPELPRGKDPRRLSSESARPPPELASLGYVSDSVPTPTPTPKSEHSFKFKEPDTPKSMSSEQSTAAQSGNQEPGNFSSLDERIAAMNFQGGDFGMPPVAPQGTADSTLPADSQHVPGFNTPSDSVTFPNMMQNPIFTSQTQQQQFNFNQAEFQDMHHGMNPMCFPPNNTGQGFPTGGANFNPQFQDQMQQNMGFANQQQWNPQFAQPQGDFGYHGNDQNNMIGFQNQGNFSNQQFGNWNQNFQGQGMGQQYGNQMNQGFQPALPQQQQQQQQMFDKRFDDGPNQNKGNFGQFDEDRDNRDNYRNRRQKKKKNKRKSRREDEDFDDRDDDDDWRRDDDRWRNDRRSDRRDDRRRDDRRKTTDHYNRDDSRNTDQYNRDDRYRNDRYKDDRRRDDKGDRRRDDRWRDERRRDDGYRESRWRDKSKDREKEKSWEGTSVKVEDPVVDDDGQATPTQDEHDVTSVEQQNIQVHNDILRDSYSRKVEDGELDTSTEAATDTLDSRIAAILKKTRASTDSISEGELADSSEPEKFVPRNKYLDTDSDHASDFSRKDKNKDRYRRETKYSERENFQHSRESSEEKQRGSHKDSDRNLLRSTFRRDRKSSPKDCTDNRTIHYRGSSSPASAGFTPNKRSPIEGSTKSESVDVCKDNSKALLESFFAGQTSDISSRESSIKNSPTDTTDIDRIDDSSKQKNLDTDGDAGVPMEVQSTASDDMSMSPISDDGQNKVQVNPEMQENQEMKNQNNLNMWNNFNTSNMNNFNNQFNHNQFQQQNFRMNIPPPNFPMGQGYQGFPGPFGSPSFNMGFPGGQGQGGFPMNPGNFQPGFQIPGQFGSNQQQQQQPPGMEQHPHYQMMARMGIWQPQMGGNYNPGMMPPQSFNSPPPNYYDQWRNQTPGNNWDQGGVPVSENQNQMQNQNFFPQYQNQQQQQQWQQSPPKMDPRQATLDEAMKQLVSELKNVMKKDLCRKMVETSAFKCLENWWDDCVEKSKPSKPETEPIKSQASSRSILSSLENTTEWSKNIKPVGMSRLDIGLGLRAAMPRMPSFKVKRKPPDEDSQEEKRRQRRRSITSDQEDDSDAERDKVDALSQTSEGSVKPSKKFTSSGSEKEEDDDEIIDEEGDLKELLQRRKRGLEAKVAEGSDEEDIYSSAGSSEDEEEEEEEEEEAESEEEWEETQSESSESSSSSEDDEDEDVDVETEEKDTDDGLKSKVDVSIVPDMLNGEMDAKMKTPIKVKDKAPAEKVKTSKKTKDADEKLAPKERPDLDAFEILVEMASKARELESEGGEETKPESSSEKTESADEEPTIRDMMLMDHSYCKMPSPPPAPPPTATSLEIEHPYSQPEKSTKLTTPKSETEAESTPIEADTPPEEVKPTKKRKRKKTELETIIEEQIQRAEQEKEAQVPLFHPRNYYDEWQKLYEILTNGIDLEDACFLRKTYSMLLQDNRHSWLNYCHWVSHPVTVFPETAFEKKRRKTEDEQGQHDTGCARTQGYYKITMKEKKRYINRPRTIGNEAEDEGRQGSEVISRTGPGVSREARLDHRRLLTSLSHTQADSVSDLLKFNHLKFRKKELKFSKSGIHGWGLYALETISQDEMVVEYVGQMVRQTIADMREKRYENLGIGSSYLFRIDSESIIDATKCGNFARFINHSCTPNCYAKIINVDSHKKIVIYSKRQINKGDEITYDYKFPIEEEKIPCLCNSSQCRGTLN